MEFKNPVVILFGYDSSPFTHKIRLALKLRQIPYFLVIVSSMMPRTILVDGFNLTYRKIPVLAIGKDLYIDTSLIFEIIDTHPAFPVSGQHPALHTDVRNRVLTRLLSSFYTDRPLFRLTTGLIPQAVWETNFGVDRSKLIGHDLDAQKLGAKVSSNLSALDTHLSILEPLFHASRGWILGTQRPCAADISFYYQLHWGERISRGEGIKDLTGGGTEDGKGDGIQLVFNRDRYPGVVGWFERMQTYMEDLPSVETRIEKDDTKRASEVLHTLNDITEDDTVLIKTTAANLNVLDARLGLKVGSRVSIAPDDTGRSNPTVGTLVAFSMEEVVIHPDPIPGRTPVVSGVRAHFPKVGFVVKPVDQSKEGRTASKL